MNWEVVFKESLIVLHDLLMLTLQATRVVAEPKEVKEAVMWLTSGITISRAEFLEELKMVDIRCFSIHWLRLSKEQGEHANVLVFFSSHRIAAEATTETYVQRMEVCVTFKVPTTGDDNLVSCSLKLSATSQDVVDEVDDVLVLVELLVILSGEECFAFSCVGGNEKTNEFALGEIEGVESI